MSAPPNKGLFHKFLSRAINFILYLLYHQFAWAYDWVADIVSIGRWKSWIAEVIPELEGARVLELGCGPGHLQLALQSSVQFVAGLDESPQMLFLARRRLSRVNDEINLVRAKAEALPFQDQFFDKVVATFPSEYIFHHEILVRIWQMLPPNGQLVILPAAWITGNGMLNRAASWLFRFTGQAPEIDGLSVEDEFLRPLNRLKEAGFQVTYNLKQLPASMVLLITAVKIMPGD
jgi:ubiquinone/menaquinone biosynthesis C-methylase UbiE